MQFIYQFILLLLIVILAACSSSDSNTSASNTDNTQDNADSTLVDPYPNQDLTSQILVNEAAYIPSQCYTKTIDTNNRVHNPCFSCHITSQAPNYTNDQDLQVAYTFPAYANTNHWTNLLQDRSAAIAAITDETILEYIRQDNYQTENQELILTARLETLPSNWDFDQDGVWDGYYPDLYFNFDDEGFDYSPEGELTGWRAFGYYPFLGTFWPTNGSTDDVLIRLPLEFRQNEQGAIDLEVYKINLAIVEALIKRENISITPVDESLYFVDLNRDGSIGGQVDTIVFEWDDSSGGDMEYVGMARLEQQLGNQKLAASLYPLGTEFLHSVRYIDIDNQDNIQLASRMKELRYGKKISWQTYADHLNYAQAEANEKHAFPDRLKSIIGNVESGVSNNLGWYYQGFIEDGHGNLRPQTYEENIFCIACHSTIGAITDSTFAFPRKFNPENTFQQGWYHWSQKGLQGIAEPQYENGDYEYSFYLQQNGAGDEFRQNQEVIDKFFDEQGNLKEDQLDILHNDITHLLFPSRERALILNKAYYLIVQEQSFIYGRDVVIAPIQNIHQAVETDQSTGIEVPVTPQ